MSAIVFEIETERRSTGEMESFSVTPAPRHSGTPLCARAFTLMELLTVIGIIGLLAALGVGATAIAKRKKGESRLAVELQQLTTAIESYKSDRNSYPPDHLLPANAAAKVDPVINQLFYELRGVMLDNQRGQFQLPGGNTWTPGRVSQEFGRRGFLNASSDARQPPTSYLNPKPSQVREINGAAGPIEVLVTPVEWPRNPPPSDPAPVPGTTANPWRYVSTSPTNNSGGFDLWAEAFIGKEKRVFKNW